MSRKLRPLSAAENLFWRPDAVCPLNSVGTLEIEGRLDPARLRIAIGQVQQRHPLLQASVVLRWNHPVFRRGAPPIPLAEITLPPEELRAFQRREAEQTFDSTRGPLLRLTLVDLGGDRSALVLTLHHAIFDGRSIIVFVQDLLKHYLQPALPVTPLPLKPGFDAALPKEYKGISGYRRFKAQQKMLGETLGGITGDLKVDNSTPIEQRRKAFDFLFIDPATTKALLSRTRKEKTTLHAILSVLLAEAIADDLGLDAAKFAIISPADVSTKLPVKFNEDIMLATSAVTCAIEVAKGENPWEAARTFRATLQHFTRAEQHLQMGPMMMKIYSLMAWWMSLGKNGAVRLVHAFNKASGFALSYTTMGDIGLASDYGEFKLSRVYCMPGYTTNSPLLALSSIFNGELVWAFGGFHEQIGEARLHRLMAACEGKLRALLSGPDA